MAGGGGPGSYGPHLDSHCTLWMGDLDKAWDAHFVADAFKHLGHEPSTVKMVTDKFTGAMAGYCFVEFSDNESARNAMLNANGNQINGASSPTRFNLSFANDPKTPSIEFNLFVNNLSREMDDADLYQVFGGRYRSCRGAKVYRNHDGSSRGLGFVRFGDQTEQQMALVEMNHVVVRGKEITLKLAAAKQRLPRSHISQGMQPFLIKHENVPMQPPQQIMQPPPMPEPEPVFISTEYPTAEQANAHLVLDGDVWWEELEESRWSSCITNSEWNDRNLGRAIIDSLW